MSPNTRGATKRSDSAVVDNILAVEWAAVQSGSLPASRLRKLAQSRDISTRSSTSTSAITEQLRRFYADCGVPAAQHAETGDAEGNTSDTSHACPATVGLCKSEEATCTTSAHDEQPAPPSTVVAHVPTTVSLADPWQPNMAEHEQLRIQLQEARGQVKSLRVQVDDLTVQVVLERSRAEAAEAAVPPVRLVVRVADSPPVPQAGVLEPQPCTQVQHDSDKQPSAQPALPPQRQTPSMRRRLQRRLSQQPNASSSQLHSQRTGQPAPGITWVAEGLDFAAGSSKSIAQSAMSKFISANPCVSSALANLSVKHVTCTARGGLIVFDLPDKAAESKLRASKVSLPKGCRVSLYRSQPRELRANAAFLRQLGQREAFLTEHDVRLARRMAAAAVDFAQRRLSSSASTAVSVSRTKTPASHIPAVTEPCLSGSRFAVLASSREVEGPSATSHPRPSTKPPSRKTKLSPAPDSPRRSPVMPASS